MDRHSHQIAASRARWRGGSTSVPRRTASVAEAERSPSSELECETLGFLNLLLLNAGYSPFRTLRLGPPAPRAGEIRVRSEPEVVEPVAIPVSERAADGSIPPPSLTPLVAAFEGAEESRRGELVLELVTDDRIEARARTPVVVQAAGEWVNLPAYGPALAGAVTPNAAAVSTFLASVGVDFHAYQSDSAARIGDELRAVYEAVGSLDLHYVPDPPSFDGTGQKILFPDELLRYRRGCCIDVALLTAALLERVGYNAVIVLVRGHALVGAWAANMRARRPVLDQPQRLLQALAEGELRIWNTTTYFERDGDTGLVAAEAAADRLMGGFEYAVDLAACRRSPYPKPYPISRNPSP